MGCSSSLPVYTDLKNAPESRETEDSHLDDGNVGDIEEILKGNLTLECPSTAKIVRIFTSSTFTDTLYERNSLIETVYPKLKEFCQSKGYEFQVVDMRWGVRDEATDDHMTSELCLREVDLCKKISTGPCFVTFLSHKYGYKYFPRQIDADEYQTLKDNMSDDSKEFLDRWFLKDENAVPPTYVLQPISSHIPSFLSKEAEDKKRAKEQWYEESERLQDTILDTAKICPEIIDVDKYQMSVTEVEIRRGILNNKQDGERSFWFHRVIDDIDSQPSSYILSRYKECTGNQDHIVEARDMLEQLQKMKLKPALPEDHYKTYNITWSENGVDPNHLSSHKQYIDTLCEDFERDMKEMITKAIVDKEKSLIHSATYQEVVQHTTFCQEKCQSFYGRQDLLTKIKSYIASDCNEPCTVFGKSGSGKTSVVAKSASSCRSWFGNKGITIIRFLGTSPESSGIGSLLLSLTKQINLIYNNEDEGNKTTLREITDGFLESLQLASKQQPLVIFLDSLDQLDPAGGATQLSWLPKKLPPNVKLILSTLPEVQYEYFPKLQAIYSKNSKLFIEVPNLPEKDAKGILEKWFSVKKRKLQPQQMKILLNAFNQCPLPLFLKLSFDEACLWKSYTVPDQTVLETTVRGMVNHLFSRVESLHGYMLVSRALGYITLSKNGLTESELEDILSCDDDVLNDVYVYWTPPLRRLPPLLLVRMRSELEQYFVTRGADGARVTYWYHRKFVEAAKLRYVPDLKTKRKMEAMLADFFSGVWSKGKCKPIQGKSYGSSADRHVASQPLMFGETYNHRKINNLAYHRLHANQLDLLKSECLCSYDFILAALKSRGLRQLLDTYHATRWEYPDDEDIKSIEEVLQLSQNALQYNPNELPSQILGRLKPSKGLTKLFEDCKKSSTYYLQPNHLILTQPGGSLLHCLAQHFGVPTSVDVSDSSQIAVTCSKDRSIILWDVSKGRLLKVFDDVADEMDCIKLGLNRMVVVKFSQGILGFNTNTGVEIFRLANAVSFCLCGKNNELICVVGNSDLSIYDVLTGKVIKKSKCQLGEIGEKSLCVGRGSYVACTVDQRKNIVLFDVYKMNYINIIKVYCEAMVFSIDSTKLYISHKFKPVLFVYDVETGDIDNIQGQDNIFAQGELKLTIDGRYAYFNYYSYVYVWDIEKRTQRILIEHPTPVTDVATADGRVIITTGEDRAVRIWDMSKSNDQHLRKFGNGNDGARIMSRELFENPRYAIFKIKRGFDWSLQLYDVCNNETIKRSTEFVPNFEVYVDETHVLICGYTRVKLLNLSSMEFEVTFEGEIYTTLGKAIIVINKAKEFITISPKQTTINIYNIKTGKIDMVLSTGENHKLESFVVNKEETKVLTQGKDGELTKFYLFELKTRTLESTFTSESMGLYSSRISSKEFLITHDGLKFMLKYKDGNRIHILICSTQNGTVLQKLDVCLCENENMFDDIKYLVLTKSTILIYYEEAFLKVFDFETGQIFLHEKSDYYVFVPEKGPYFVTRGKSRSTNAVRLWDRENLDVLASYFMDSEIHTVQITKDGYHIIMSLQTSGDPIIFTLQGGPKDPKYFHYKQLTEYPEIFTKSDEDRNIMVLEYHDKRRLSK